MSIYAYAIAALIIFLAGAGAAHRYDTGQYAIKENARLEQVREQEKAARATERAQANNVITAQNEARKRESVALAAASSARTELGRLRNTLSGNVGACTTTDSAGIQRTDPARELFGECAQALTDLAATADRLDSDRRTLMEAWPR